MQGMGLTISVGKAKVLAWHPVCAHNALIRYLQLGNEEENMQVVEDFEYLGNTISNDCLLDHEIDR